MHYYLLLTLCIDDILVNLLFTADNGINDKPALLSTADIGIDDFHTSLSTGDGSMGKVLVLF